MKGVAFTHPPTNLRAQVDEAIATALDVSKVKPGELVMVGIGTNVGWNAAVALKTPSSFEVEVFIGLNWGQKITYGARVTKRFRLGG